jgi:hypothetical protein
MARVDYWNHNVHYQPVILAAVPADCGRALDVGCGDGLLAARLADRCTEVTDFLTYPLPEASFDFVCANTSLHHMDFEQALTTMTRLLRPGGRLAVIGIAADGSIGDTLAAAASVIANRYYQAVHHEADPGAPVKAPATPYSGPSPGAFHRRRYKRLPPAGTWCILVQCGRDRATQSPPTPRLLADRRLRYVLAALVASGMADGFLPVIVSFAVLHVTGSVGQLGLVLACQSTAALVLTLAGGLAADHFSRGRILLCSVAARAVAAASLAALLLTGMASFPLLLAAAGVYGCADGLRPG